MNVPKITATLVSDCNEDDHVSSLCPHLNIETPSSYHQVSNPFTSQPPRLGLGGVPLTLCNEGHPVHKPSPLVLRRANHKAPLCFVGNQANICQISSIKGYNTPNDGSPGFIHNEPSKPHVLGYDRLSETHRENWMPLSTSIPRRVAYVPARRANAPTTLSSGHYRAKSDLNYLNSSYVETSSNLYNSSASRPVDVYTIPQARTASWTDGSIPLFRTKTTANLRRGDTPTKIAVGCDTLELGKDATTRSVSSLALSKEGNGSSNGNQNRKFKSLLLILHDFKPKENCLKDILSTRSNLHCKVTLGNTLALRTRPVKGTDIEEGIPFSTVMLLPLSREKFVK